MRAGEVACREHSGGQLCPLLGAAHPIHVAQGRGLCDSECRARRCLPLESSGCGRCLCPNSASFVCEIPVTASLVGASVLPSQ